MIIHKPVLLKEILTYINPSDQVIVDTTLGHGGHSIAMAQQTNGQSTIIGIDTDNKMLHKARQQIDSSKSSDFNFILVQDSYANIDKILKDNGNLKADFILADLGVNMDHFKDTSRGFSIKGEADLDMRFDQNNPNSAYNIINTYKLEKLQDIFCKYGDFTDSKSKEIANQIIIDRNKKKIQTTLDLKKLLNQLGLGDKACTVIFQSIRIETNNEINNLQSLLDKLPDILNTGGRCAIISYHSIEDRLTKQTFKQLDKSSNFKLLTPKAIKPHYTEIQSNKASRSAILRVIQKLN